MRQKIFCASSLKMLAKIVILQKKKSRKIREADSWLLSFKIVIYTYTCNSWRENKVKILYTFRIIQRCYKHLRMGGGWEYFGRKPANHQIISFWARGFSRHASRDGAFPDIPCRKREAGTGYTGRVFGNRLEIKAECPSILILFYIMLYFVDDKDKSPDTRQTDEQDGWKEVAHFNWRNEIICEIVYTLININILTC